MYRIGIVGSDSSHASAFSALINKPDSETRSLLFPDCTVSGIYGEDLVKTKEIADKNSIPFVAENPEELIDKVDAVMVVLRHGDLHKEYAMPFIKRGIPTWIDKPFTLKEEDALELIEAAKERKTLLTGGSTCRHAPEIKKAREERINGSKIGNVKNGFLSFITDFNSPYGGAAFYGVHLLEMALEIFGDEILKISAVRSKGAMTVVLTYESCEATLSFQEDIAGCPLLLVGDQGLYYDQVNMSEVYRHGVESFITMLRTGVAPTPPERLAVSVKIFNEIIKEAGLMKEE